MLSSCKHRLLHFGPKLVPMARTHSIFHSFGSCLVCVLKNWHSSCRRFLFPSPPSPKLFSRGTFIILLMPWHEQVAARHAVKSVVLPRELNSVAKLNLSTPLPLSVPCPDKFFLLVWLIFHMKQFGFLHNNICVCIIDQSLLVIKIILQL